MAPRVEGLSVRQTQALRVLALGGQTMRFGRTKIRFTTKGGVHLDLPFVAVRDRLVAYGLVKDAGGGTYLITPKGKMLSDVTAQAYREEWEARVVARKAEAETPAGHEPPAHRPWWEQPTAETLEESE